MIEEETDLLIRLPPDISLAKKAAPGCSDSIGPRRDLNSLVLRLRYGIRGTGRDRTPRVLMLFRRF